jgi:hypothetical protein
MTRAGDDLGLALPGRGTPLGIAVDSTHLYWVTQKDTNGDQHSGAEYVYWVDFVGTGSTSGTVLT